MSVIEMIAAELAYWRLKFGEIEAECDKKSDSDPRKGWLANSSDDHLERYRRLEELLSYYQPTSQSEARIIAIVLAERAAVVEHDYQTPELPTWQIGETGRLAQQLRDYLVATAPPDHFGLEAAYRDDAEDNNSSVPVAAGGQADRAEDEPTLIEALWTDLKDAWAENERIDDARRALPRPAGSQVPRLDLDNPTPLARDWLRIGNRIQALESGIVAARPMTAADATIQMRLLRFEVSQFEDVESGAGCRRYFTSARMLSNGLVEYLAKVTGARGEDICAAYDGTGRRRSCRQETPQESPTASLPH